MVLTTMYKIWPSWDTVHVFVLVDDQVKAFLSLYVNYCFHDSIHDSNYEWNLTFCEFIIESKFFVLFLGKFNVISKLNG